MGKGEDLDRLWGGDEYDQNVFQFKIILNDKNNKNKKLEK